MLNHSIERRLNNITDLPVVPAHLGQILKSLDNPNIRAKKLAEQIETDQSLTTKILKAANSPYYGSAGRISTIELAIVIMGLNTIKEIIIGMVVRKFFNKVPSYLFDVKLFWNYSIYCGSASRLIARKIGFKKAGEAFVAGLMHDLGILIIIQYFSHEFSEINSLVQSGKYTMRKAEQLVIGADHCELGSWLANKWSLPAPLVNSIKYHHSKPSDLPDDIDEDSVKLSMIVSASEWFAQLTANKSWSNESEQPPYFSTGKDILNIYQDELIDLKGSIALFRHEIDAEFSRASELNP
ncbi:HDOD domain-containing protein [Candidatus Kapabacteria bacterium]|nr:HDOD domain-containing protein [Candidatus Kapabacteria bacterium]